MDSVFHWLFMCLGLSSKPLQRFMPKTSILNKIYSNFSLHMSADSFQWVPCTNPLEAVCWWSHYAMGTLNNFWGIREPCIWKNFMEVKQITWNVQKTTWLNKSFACIWKFFQNTSNTPKKCRLSWEESRDLLPAMLERMRKVNTATMSWVIFGRENKHEMYKRQLGSINHLHAFEKFFQNTSNTPKKCRLSWEESRDLSPAMLERMRKVNTATMSWVIFGRENKQGQG